MIFNCFICTQPQTERDPGNQTLRELTKGLVLQRLFLKKTLSSENSLSKITLALVNNQGDSN